MNGIVKRTPKREQMVAGKGPSKEQRREKIQGEYSVKENGMPQILEYS